MFAQRVLDGPLPPGLATCAIGAGSTAFPLGVMLGSAARGSKYATTTQQVVALVNAVLSAELELIEWLGGKADCSRNCAAGPGQ